MESIITKKNQNWNSCVVEGRVGNLSSLKIDHTKFSAEISLFGGQLLSYTRKGEAPLIWLGEKAKFDGSIPIRGGVPICFPWFGTKESKPTHGFARTSLWELETYNASEHSVEVILSLSYDANTLKLWPNKFKSILKFELSDEVVISMETINLDSKSWEYSGALHTYLNIADISLVSIDGVGKSYFDGTSDYELTQSEVPMTIDCETIRVSIDSQDEITVSDVGNHRGISVTNSGHNAAVIWNPWAETTRSMSDMADDEYQNMVCVESTIYHHKPVTIEPGKIHCISTKIALVD
ncbi:D-hexose-6-phosphate mutarotase [Vibrio owensii]|uniref:D-hexose-6-phosphate mutarotase n=1 Tax=Vibrio owensii TaxID=696485 RepID=UPI0040679F1F